MSFGQYYSDWNINGTIIHSHLGAGSIVSYKYFNNKIDEIYKYTTEDRVNKGIKCPDDVLYTYASLLNGFLYKRCERYKIKLNSYNPNNISFSESNSQRIILNEQYHNIIQNYIKNKYNITVEQLRERLEYSHKKVGFQFSPKGFLSIKVNNHVSVQPHADNPMCSCRAPASQVSDRREEP